MESERLGREGGWAEGGWDGRQGRERRRGRRRRGRMVMVVWLTEVVVDWIKHAFVAKFNKIDPARSH